MGAYPDTEWYFAEGYTGAGFDQWLTLQNPGDVATTATITYMFKGGGNHVQSVNIDPRSRATVSVNEAVGPNKEVSTMIQSTEPIVAERPMYFNYKGCWTGGHNVVGFGSALSAGSPEESLEESFDDGLLE